MEIKVKKTKRLTKDKNHSTNSEKCSTKKALTKDHQEDHNSASHCSVGSGRHRKWIHLGILAVAVVFGSCYLSLIHHSRSGGVQVDSSRRGSEARSNSKLNSDHSNNIVEEGGWVTYKRDILVDSGPCNIPIIDANTVSQAEFLQRYAYRTPVLIRNGSNSSSDDDVNGRFREACQRENLLRDWGHATVTLSSANTHSYGTKEVPLSHYIQHMVGPQNLKTLANETYYFFGYNDMEEWKDFFALYRLPPYGLPGHTHALSFGLAGPGSGVPFHFHGPGFAETLHGRKRWFLTPPPPQKPPEFNPNMTTLQWFLEDYNRVSQQIDISECTVSPGEIIYFPDRWWHATLNLDTAVFISTFLSP